MTKHTLAAAVVVLAFTTAAVSRGGDDAAKPAAAAAGTADKDKAVAAVIDKAAEALGGKDKLAAVKGATWSSKGTLTIGGTSADFTAKLAYHGHDRRRVEFKADFGGNPIDAVIVVNGEKGWRKFNDAVEELAGDGLVTERFGGYREWTPVNVLLLKSPQFKVEPAGEDKVDGKPAPGVKLTGLKVTGPVGAPFTIYFDKETGLPAKMTATVPAFGGGEAQEQVFYSDYKDFGGVKKATKVEAKHDGQTIIKSELSDFKVLDEPKAGTFEKPE